MWLPPGNATLPVMSAREHVLGIDEGTTGVRAAVVGPDGAIRASAYREIDQSFPQPGWVEHDATRLAETTRAVCREAIAAARLEAADLAAVGITNQRASAVVFDERGRPLGPVLGWQDQRTLDRCGELFAQGIFVLPNMAATKWDWLLAKLSPEARRKARLGTIDSFLAASLSGGSVHASDHSNFSVTGVYDLMAGVLDAGLIEKLGFEMAMLPRLVDSSEVVGETARQIFGASVPIAALAGDQHAAMYAQGCHARGMVELELGTSGMVKRNEGEGLTELPAGTYPLVLWALDGRRSFCLEAPVLTAGATAQWLRDGLGIVENLAAIEPLARSVPSAEGVWAVPAFQGLGGPYLDLNARAVIGGLSRASTRAHVARALLDGVAWRCAEAWQALAGPVPAAPLRVGGGAAANDLLLQTLADAAGAPVERPAVLERAVLGAAFLAGRAVGLWSDEKVASRWTAARVFEPMMGADERGERRRLWEKRIAAVRELSA